MLLLLNKLNTQIGFLNEMIFSLRKKSHPECLYGNVVVVIFLVVLFCKYITNILKCDKSKDTDT